MKNPFRNERFFAVILSIFISVFFVTLFVYGVTTIGTNVSSDGTGHFESASTSNDFWLGNRIADDDDYLYFDASSSEYLMWDDVPGMFYFSDDLAIAGNASTTGYFIVGDLSGDDDDFLYFDTSRTESFSWDDSPGEFDLSDDLNIGGKATSTGLWVGAGGEANNVNMTNDLYVQDGAEIDGGLWADSATTTDSLAIGGYASSTGNVNTQSNLHVGGNADVDGTFKVGKGTTMTKFLFGACDIVNVSITASSSAYTDCKNATDVVAGDKVFVTATSSLPDYFVIQTASSTTAGQINIKLYNLGGAGSQATGGRSFYWQAIR